MPSLVVAFVWLGFTSYVELRKKSSRWIPLSLVGLTFCNKSLAVIELFLFSAYNMPKLLVYTILAGFVVPIIFSTLFVVAWRYKFLRDRSVLNHYNDYRILHVSMLVATFIGDYRSWKYLYTNINNHTSLLCFKVQFKYWNRGFSFVSLISDCVLCFAGVSAFTKGGDFILVWIISLERIIISSVLIALTITEWGFKSKISKSEKKRIFSVNSVHDMKQQEILF